MPQRNRGFDYYFNVLERELNNLPSYFFDSVIHDVERGIDPYVEKDDKGNQSYKMIHEVPGIKKENINVEYYDDSKLKVIIEFSKDDVLGRSGKETYIYRIPKADGNRIKTHLEDGILSVSCPFKEEMNKTIKVEIS